MSSLSPPPGSARTDSKFRNMFGQTWRRERWYTNLKVASAGGSDSLLAANSRFIAIPWAAHGGDGRLCVVPVAAGEGKKVPDTPSLILAHREAIVDCCFAQTDECLVATGSRDSTVKVWRVPPDGLTQSISEPLCTLTHEKRVLGTAFHPFASDVIMSACADNVVRVWDVATHQEKVAVGPHPDTVQSSEWDGEEGKLILTACKDLHTRVFDPRAGTMAMETRCAEGPKGFRSIWLDGRGMVLTCGFGKTGQRQIAFWDTRALSSTALSTVVVDELPSSIIPFYDSSLGLLFLGGRGTVVPFFEVSRTEPVARYLGKFQTAVNHISMAMMPKRACEIMKLEVDRFLALTTNNTIEQFSFTVPRKENANLFHEDLYPPIPTGEPLFNSTVWFENNTSCKPKLASLQPKGTTSVYEVAIEDGGKSRAVEEGRAATASSAPGDADKPSVKVISEGPVKMLAEGWVYSSYVPRFFSIAPKRLYVFETAESPASLFSLSLPDCVFATVPDTKTRFTITVAAKVYYVEAPDEDARQSWILSLTKEKEEQAQPEGEKPAAVMAVSDEDSPVSGKLTEISIGYLRSTARKHFFVKDGVLYSQGLSWWYEAPTGNPTEMCHLEKILNIVPDDTFLEGTAYMFDGSTRGAYFQIATPVLVFHLIAKDVEDRQRWIASLDTLRQEADAISRGSTPVPKRNRQQEEEADYPPEDLEKEDDEKRFETEVQVFRGIGPLGYWTVAFMSVHSEEMFFFKGKTATAPFYRASLRLAAESFKPFPGVETDIQNKFADGTPLYLRAKDVAHRAKVMAALEDKRRSSLDLLEVLGISPDNLHDDPSVADTAGVIEIGDIDKGRHPLLIEVVGKRRIRAWVTRTAVSSLNPNNPFVLDTGHKQFVWNGSKASRVAKAKAIDLGNRIRMKDRSGRSEVLILDQGASDNSFPDFWKHLNGTVRDVPDAGSCADLAAQDKDERGVAVYRVCPRSSAGKKKLVSLIHAASDPNVPSREILHCNLVYVIDAGEAEIYVWVGKTSDNDQRKLGMLLAKRLRAQPGRPSHAFVLRVLQGGEPMIMKEKFCGFPGMLPIHTGTIDIVGNVAVAVPQRPVSEIVAQMQVQVSAKPDPRKVVPDEGLGTLKIWKIEEFGLVPYPQELYGQFFSGESYVIVYTYTTKNRDVHVIYFWQGRDSTINEKGTSAYLTAEKADELKGNESSQVRIVQFKETEHFMKVFRNRYIIHTGKLAGYNNNRTGLYDVRGHSAIFCKAVESVKSAKSLNSYHCSVLKMEKTVFVRNGRLSTSDERACALATANILKGGRDIVVVPDGSEPDPFWATLGGRDWTYSPQPTPEKGRAFGAAHSSRLFMFSQGSGAVDFIEESLPCQDDFVDRGVFIMDAWHAVWIWVGPKALVQEKRIAFEAAKAYIKGSQVHPAETPVLVVQPFHEPPAFRTALQSWSETKLRAPRGETFESRDAEPVDVILGMLGKREYTYQELLSDTLPEGVDPSKLETYLAEEEFRQVFKMDPNEFAKLKKWHQENLKREVGLY